MTPSAMPFRPILFAFTLISTTAALTLHPHGTANAAPMSQNHPVSLDHEPSDVSVFPAAFGDPAICQEFDPVKRYGPVLQFQIRRNDTPVGSHTVNFNRGRDGLQVIAQSAIDISFFGFNAYSFRYRSESLWRDGELRTLSVQVDDDGEMSDIEAIRNQSGLLVSGPDGEETLPSGIFPTDHWHCGVLGSTSVLNTITGKPNDVEITAKPGAMLRTTNGELRATQFTYDGELQTNAWYDRDGRWVGLQFKARDGSEITYRCMNCTAQTAFEDRG